MSGKPYEQLTLADDYMFCKVMSRRSDLCKMLLEAILERKIEKLTVIDTQKGVEVAPDVHGIRLDIFLKDETDSYDVEMQTTYSRYLPQRSRYYHSILDVDELEKGIDYSRLKPIYVIFICIFDPFDKGLPIYHFENLCKEDTDFALSDGTYKIFLNITAEVKGNTLLKEFFDYLRNQSIHGTFTKELNQEVILGRQNGEWRREYMRNEARYMDALIKGREQGIVQEQKNTERERLAKEDAMAEVIALRKELEKLKKHSV